MLVADQSESKLTLALIVLFIDQLIDKHTVSTMP